MPLQRLPCLAAWWRWFYDGGAKKRLIWCNSPVNQLVDFIVQRPKLTDQPFQTALKFVQQAYLNTHVTYFLVLVALFSAVDSARISASTSRTSQPVTCPPATVSPPRCWCAGLPSKCGWCRRCRHHRQWLDGVWRACRRPRRACGTTGGCAGVAPGIGRKGLGPSS